VAGIDDWASTDVGRLASRSTTDPWAGGSLILSTGWVVHSRQRSIGTTFTRGDRSVID
jgi:hypothetical protein